LGNIPFWADVVGRPGSSPDDAVSVLSSANPRRRREAIRGYVIALVLVAFCTLIVAWLQHTIHPAGGDRYRPYTVLYVGAIAYIVSAFGVGPGLAALSAALAVTAALFTPTPDVGVASVAGVRVRDLIEMAGMLLAGSLMIWGANHHRTQRERLRGALDRIESLRAGQERMLADVLRSATQGKLLLHGEDTPFPGLSQVLARVPLQETRDLARLRAAVRAAAGQVRLPDDRAMAVLTAAHESAMNAIVHGGGGFAVLGHLEDEETFAVQITDMGPGIALDKLPERTLHGGVSGANSLGMGFSLVIDGADRVHLRTTPEGTRVLLEVHREPLPPAWFHRSIALA
jgi:serine/threonine-protein kinase RsbT